MKSCFATALFIVLPVAVFPQETKRIIQKFSHSKQIAEEYTVLKADQHTRHGTYVSYFRMSGNEYKKVKTGVLQVDDFVKEKGQYKNGKKDGEWLEYAQPKILNAKGTYTADQKTGIWEKEVEQGQVLERYDYDTKTKLEPVIKVAIAYPKRARAAGIQGTVIVRYQLNKDCSISNITIDQSVSADCDKAAVDTIVKMSALLKKYSLGCADKMETREVTFRLDE